MTECCAFLQKNQITETSNEFSFIENGNSQTPSKAKRINIKKGNHKDVHFIF